MIKNPVSYTHLDVYKRQNQPLAPSYTESTPVEDILKVMTFEEAQNVVVDSGLSKGKTMATVAKERPVSLKFYLTPGNKSTNNIVRAAAQIMLDGMAAQKAEMCIRDRFWEW